MYRNKFATFVNTSKSECGATLIWRLTHGPDIHPFVQVIRIGDTWQWNDYPELEARSVLKSLHMKRTFRSFSSIEDTCSTWDANRRSYAENGRVLAEYETAMVKRIAKQCDLGFIQTADGTVYNVAYTQANILHSEVGSMIKWYAQKRFKMPIHMCATWKYVSYKGLVSVSLRDGDPGVNLSSVARNIKGGNGKGGGHAEAAGFSFFGLENFHNFILKSIPVQEIADQAKTD
jgi:oligoribonuclease NrnB/cAMP/cGMP phosphodiesterase (DHH superfamily)